MLFELILAASALLRPLDDIALETGTDKSSLFHNYTELYAEEFAPFRQEPIRFLEIGIFKGDSVKMWEEYFPKAELYFIDITDALIAYRSERSHYYFLDQRSPKELAAFLAASGGSFDLIIDDGGHTMEQQVESFKELFPSLNPGGIYVIEDLHTSYWASYGGKGSPALPKPSAKSATEFLKTLVDDVNLIAAKSTCADQAKAPLEVEAALAPYRQQIKGIYFASGICLIYKR